jgi:hypothetical protein
MTTKENLIQMRLAMDALRQANCPVWVHNAAITQDIEALRRIALWFSSWNNTIRLPVTHPHLFRERNAD